MRGAGFVSAVRRERHLVVLVSYTLLTVVFTFPLAFRIGTALPGMPTDTYLYIWNLEWVKHALFDVGTNPYFTDAMFYPTGVNLYYFALILGTDVLALPLQLAFGAPAAYMLMTLAMFVLSGYGAYLLAYDFCRHSGAAFLAGFIYTFAPYHLAHLDYAHFDLMALQWIPFALLAAKKYLERPGWRLYILTLVLLLWVSITNWYYTLFAGLLIALYTFYVALRSRSVMPFLRVALVGVAYLIILSPLFYQMYQVAASGQLVPARALRQSNRFSADLVAFVLPITQHAIWGGLVAPLAEQFNGGSAERGIFYGYVPLALAIWAVVRRRSPPVWFWVAVVLIFTALALGPVLHVGGTWRIGPNGTAIVLPQMALYKLPGISAIFNFARAISRFSIVGMLGVAVLAAYGIRELTQAMSLRRATGAMCLIGILIGIEFLVRPIPTTSLQVPEIVEQWRNDPEPFGVLNLPPQPQDIGALGMYYWTIDGKPRVNGYHSQKVPNTLLEGEGAIRALSGDATDILVGPQPTAAQVLQFFDIKYVMLHKRFKLAGENRTRIEQAWGAQALVYEDETVAVYQVPNAELTPLVVMFDPTNSVSQKMGWGSPRTGHDQTRWRTLRNEANILVYAKTPRSLRFSFDAIGLNTRHDLQVLVNNQPVYQGHIEANAPAHIQFDAPAAAGKNMLELRVSDATQGSNLVASPPIHPAELGISQLAIQPAP